MASKLALPHGTKVPDHIAFVLDGNRRWARSRGLQPWKGHAEGYKAIINLARSSRNLGVHTFTVWAFSTENWERPEVEINEIFSLLRKAIKEMRKELVKEKVRFIHLGRKDRFPRDVAEGIAELEEATRKYTGHVFNLALDSGGRDDIVRAVQKIVEDKVSSDKIDQELIASYLDTHDQLYPYVDLFIRTSGEQRTSGFMLWQAEYAEFYFEDCHLPDFTPEKLKTAILDYSRRRRRFGANDSEKHLVFKPEVAAKFELRWWRLANIPQGKGFTQYAFEHLREQYGLSKHLAARAGKYFGEAVKYHRKQDLVKAKKSLKSFFILIKEELKLAFEPDLVASLKLKFWQEVTAKDAIERTQEVEEAAREYYAEAYRISLLQATKLAHLRVLANLERNIAEKAPDGDGEEHWEKAEDYLQLFYKALKDRVA